MKKILVAMSGGVDSAAAALLMKKTGYNVCGATLILDGNFDEAERARRVAEKLGIEFFSIDMSSHFRENVIVPFIDEYCNGKTPNPCIRCNKSIKFGLLYDEAIKSGFDGLATGHYARVSWNVELSEPILSRAIDESKDQSYVLYSVNRDYFKNIYFPLGHYSKSEIRKIAKDEGFENADSVDSQDICFIKDGDYSSFIRKERPNCDCCGNFLNSDGSVLGKHKGIISYTVGQRRGLGIAAEAPLYVLRKNVDDNSIVLGFEDELYTSNFRVEDVNILRPSVCIGEVDCKVRTRYHQKEAECKAFFGEGEMKVTLKSPIRLPAPGQSAVFYLDESVIAGGKII